MAYLQSILAALYLTEAVLADSSLLRQGCEIPKFSLDCCNISETRQDRTKIRLL